ncbi:hypothetical protein YC2023_034021 [Brassica napus]
MKKRRKSDAVHDRSFPGFLYGRIRNCDLISFRIRRIEPGMSLHPKPVHYHRTTRSAPILFYFD